MVESPPSRARQRWGERVNRSMAGLQKAVSWWCRHSTNIAPTRVTFYLTAIALIRARRVTPARMRRGLRLQAITSLRSCHCWLSWSIDLPLVQKIGIIMPISPGWQRWNPLVQYFRSIEQFDHPIVYPSSLVHTFNQNRTIF